MVRRHLPGSANSVSPMNAVKPSFRPVARLLALALAFAAAAPRAGLAYDSDHDAEKTRLRLQKEEEIRKMEEREEAARRRIAWNREKGDAELSEIREIVKQGRTAVDSATELVRTLMREGGAEIPPELQTAGRNCVARLMDVERRTAEEEARLHSPDFVSEKVVVALVELKHEAQKAVADAQRLSDAVAKFKRDLDEKARLRRLLFDAVVTASVLAAALVVVIVVALSRGGNSGRAHVSRGPLRPVHPLPK